MRLCLSPQLLKGGTGEQGLAPCTESVLCFSALAWDRNVPPSPRGQQAAVVSSSGGKMS